MLTQDQNTIIYLMFLNGLLFMGLNFVAYSIIFPGPSGSRRIGYTLVIAALSALCLQQEFRALVAVMEIDSNMAAKVLLAGFAAPVFLVSLVYYRTKKNRRDNPTLHEPVQGKHDTD